MRVKRLMRPNFQFCCSSISLLSLLTLSLAGCSVSSFKNPIDKIQPYRIDIPQGNVVTQEMLAKLKPGMTRAQVKFVLGTPLVVDPFHSQRWDYFYSLLKDGKKIEQRRITVIFDGDSMKGLEGDINATPAVEVKK